MYEAMLISVTMLGNQQLHSVDDLILSPNCVHHSSMYALVNLIWQKETLMML